MNYDDQNYSEVNPETLDLQSPAEVILTVWAAMRPCREITAKGHNRELNRWVRWAEPKKWNPDCGFEVSVSGRYFGKTVFASVALNIVGDDYEIYVQRSGHDLVQVFSTGDEGPILSPKARLTAATSKMMELTKLFDQWSRERTVAENFPNEWIGTPGWEMFRSYIAHKYVDGPWTGGSSLSLVGAIFKEKVIRQDSGIEWRCRNLMKSKGWSRPVAVSASLLRAALFSFVGLLMMGWFAFLGYGAVEYLWTFEELQNQWATSTQAIYDLANPSEISGIGSWLQQVIAFPILVLSPLLAGGMALWMLIVAVRHVSAVWMFFGSRRR